MSIIGRPTSARPQDKLLSEGPHTLTDAEIVAILVRTGFQGRSAVDTAEELLITFGGLRALLSADRLSACSHRGFGNAKYATLQAALELSQRCLAERMCHSDALTSPQAARAYLHARLRDLPYEAFCCLYLDTRHRPITFKELFRGTIDGATVYPREVVRTVLANNAAAVIVAHNHPSGMAEPSAADQSLTQRLKSALSLVDVRLIDHIVIGDGDAVSFSERGLL